MVKRPSNLDIAVLDQLDEEQLLDLRICDLPIDIENSRVSRALQQLMQELGDKGLKFRPHVWFASEWFAPDGIPGIAVPFFLAHERLLKLEKKMMLEAEGEGHKECMRILRHEAGHAVDNAFKLHTRKSWRDNFGLYSKPYPEVYRPRPNSRNFVQHLDAWYAQAHPAEDFAETFAVWLSPTSKWRKVYQGWPALKKLEYVDSVMQELAGKSAIVKSRRQIEPISSVTLTLRRYYERKRKKYSTELPGFYDRDLKKIFSMEEKDQMNKQAAVFLKEIRSDIVAQVSEFTGTPSYSVLYLLRDIIERTQQLKLRLKNSEEVTRQQCALMLTVQTMTVIHRGRYLFAL